MRRGLALAALLAVLLSGAGLPTSASLGDSQLLLDHDDLVVSERAVVHAVVEPPPGPVADRVEVRLVVEGPGHTEQIEHEADVSGRSPQLVTMTWTPDDPGTHRLDADARFAGERVNVAERTVYVAPQGQAEDESLAQRAPGAVQWGIVVAGFYLYLRHRSTPD